jgi:predicted RNase H-like nuclease (RuvC/YqgF family)
VGNEGERLAALEAEISSLKSLLVRMDTKLDTWSAHYLPRTEAAEMFRSRDERIRDLSEELMRMREEKQQTKQLIPAWLQTAIALAAVVVSIFALRS